MNIVLALADKIFYLAVIAIIAWAFRRTSPTAWLEGKINATTVFLFICIVALACVMFFGEYLWPNDGQFFQLFAGIMGSLVTLFVQQVKHVFAIPESQGDTSTTVKTAAVSVAVTKSTTSEGADNGRQQE